MPSWAWTLVGAAGGATVVAVGGYVWLVWYLTRNNPM